jgi:squalene-hopene/tetraprenyl-beta-curcumene cyclase
VLAAWQAWLAELQEPLEAPTRRAIARAISYLRRTQNPDGSWTPLWFGNQHSPGEENPTYGTARTAMALRDLASPLFRRALQWLEGAQNPDGGWGGGPGTPSSIEETALALQAFSSSGTQSVPYAAAIHRGTKWLIERTAEGTRIDAAPIGLYFARLWYFEELYPLIFSVGAMAKTGAFGIDE